jgi:hypothetical protein
VDKNGDWTQIVAFEGKQASQYGLTIGDVFATYESPHRPLSFEYVMETIIPNKHASSRNPLCFCLRNFPIRSCSEFNLPKTGSITRSESGSFFQKRMKSEFVHETLTRTDVIDGSKSAFRPMTIHEHGNLGIVVRTANVDLFVLIISIVC